MATRQRKGGPSGRITPKGGPVSDHPAGTRSPHDAMLDNDREETPAKATGNKATNAKGPGRRPPLDPETPVTVGRRPSSPGFLALVAVMWLAVGVVLFLTLSTGWRLIPAIVAFGIGLLFLRGAVSTVLRRDRRSSQ